MPFGPLHRRVGVTLATVILAVAVLTAPAGASDLDLLVFNSSDAGSSTFTTLGAKVAQRGEGPAMLLTVGGGARWQSFSRPAGGRMRARRFVLTTAAVFGAQWSLDQGTVGVFAGPESTLDLLTGSQGLSREATGTGLRLQPEIWLRPTGETLLQATLVASTSRRSVWTRVAGGVRLGEGYVGPEAGCYADATGYRKCFIGAHATDFTLAGRHLRLSIGGQAETDIRRIQPYLGFAVWEDW